MKSKNQATHSALDRAEIHQESLRGPDGDFPLLGNPATTVLRVLVVEDEEALGTALQERLVTSGLDVAWARDGQEAIETLRSRDFVAVLLDLNVPRLHGLKLLHAMRVLPDVARPPVVVLTGGDETVIERAERQGVFAVLRKPADVASITAVIREAVAFTRIHA